jgi:hypothetical protein
VIRDATEEFGEGLRKRDPAEWDRRYCNGLKLIANQRRVEASADEFEQLFGLEFAKDEIPDWQSPAPASPHACSPPPKSGV